MFWFLDFFALQILAISVSFPCCLLQQLSATFSSRRTDSCIWQITAEPSSYLVTPFPDPNLASSLIGVFRHIWRLHLTYYRQIHIPRRNE